MPHDLDQAFAGLRADCAEVPLSEPGQLRRVGSRRRTARLGLTVGGAAAVVAVVAVASGTLPSPWSAPPRPGDSPSVPTPSVPPSPTPTQAPTPPAGGILPWLSDAAQWPTPTMPSEHPPSAPCQAGALDPRPLVTGGVAMGTAGTSIELINTGGAACSLTGYPAVEHTDGGRTSTVPMDRAEKSATAVSLMPGEAAQFSMRYTNGLGGYPPGAPECAHPVSYHRLVLVLADGERFGLGDTALTIECGGIHAYPWAQAPLPTRLVGLVATVQAPTTVRAGTALEYVVTLSNPTDRAIALDPCPVYQQTFAEESINALNCAINAVPAHGTVRYAIRTNVPATTSVGSLQLDWMLLGRDAYVVTTATAFVKVTRA
jgi:hypothetical protein